ARFVARGIDISQKHLTEVLTRAHAHRGTSMVEIIQNCVVYNDGAFEHFTAKKTAADTQIEVEDGKPLLFGKEKDKGIRLDPKTLALEVVTVGQDGVTEDDILVHDEKNRI
ncbi:MAG TPA: 2-oxoacid:ferredoxin oxidoreductase subunit beta, partial [Alphaproteobacteria bacterium]|nr:2-oxoacid:ferredoxin oxidoreductase subunit beta [Alphaproteobacteria bacterium]